MSQLYDIFFAAKRVEGFDEVTVRSNVASLFKAKGPTLEKLFSGKPQLIKRGVDKPTAIKYKSAMQKAGAVALIRAHPNTAAAAPPVVTRPKAARPAPGVPARKKIPATAVKKPVRTAAAKKPAPAASPGVQDNAISLAPVGSDVLREDEREVYEELDIDTSAIHLGSEQDAPVSAAAKPPPPAPDTSHMSMGEVGEEIPQLKSAVESVNPDVSHLSMGEVGEEIPQLVNEQEQVNPDIDGIDLAPEGSDLLEEQYKKSDTTAPPSTDKLSLED
jgi:hypothetical protein